MWDMEEKEQDQQGRFGLKDEVFFQLPGEENHPIQNLGVYC